MTTPSPQQSSLSQGEVVNPKVGSLRVWWVPQVPMPAFHVPVASVAEAHLVLSTLGDYDRFQFENRVKGDYCNVGGLEMYEADNGDGVPGWCEWCDAQGEDIDHTEDGRPA